MPPNDWSNPQQRRRPHERNHNQCPFLGPLAQVQQRRLDGPVPVEAEDEEIQDGRCAGDVVYADPDLADGHAEHPVDGEDVHGTDGHHRQAHDQVGDGQADDESVADLQRKKEDKL